MRGHYGTVSYFPHLFVSGMTAWGFSASIYHYPLVSVISIHKKKSEVNWTAKLYEKVITEIIRNLTARIKEVKPDCMDG